MFEFSQREKRIQASNFDHMGLATIYLTIPLPQKSEKTGILTQRFLWISKDS